MKKIIFPLLASLVILLLIVMHIPDHNTQKNVLYGERHAIFAASKNTSRLFFDKMGHLYPKEEISLTCLANNDASIQLCLKNDALIFSRMATAYQLTDTLYSDNNFARLQMAIIAEQTHNINQKIQSFYHVYCLIHGFRKPTMSQHGTTSALVDNLVTQAVITGQVQGDNYFIEVYWDGMYDFFEAQKRNQHLETFALFENEARTNAVFTGYALRKIIPHITTNKITLITHSLGARVALSCLFNTYTDYVTNTLQALPTPSQDTVYICLVAPAIGNAPFDLYYNRNTSLSFSQNDNYKLAILYNEEDLVLLKKWNAIGPGPTKFGDTSLGCNYEQAIHKLQTTFTNQYPNSALSLIEVQVGKTHLVEHYMLSDGFRMFLDSTQ